MNDYMRPNALDGFTVKFRMACGGVYMTLNSDSGRLRELFIRVGKAGGCQGNLTQGLARTISISLQAGIGPEKLGRTLIGMQCDGAQPGSAEDPNRLNSCLDGLGRLLIKIGKKQKEEGK